MMGLAQTCGLGTQLFDPKETRVESPSSGAPICEPLCFGMRVSL